MTQRNKTTYHAGSPERHLVYAWAGEVEGLRAEINRLQTALRRIVSLEKKNVPKYAQEIAKTALKGV